MVDPMDEEPKGMEDGLLGFQADAALGDILHMCYSRL